MSWSSIIGQYRVKNILQRAIAEGRIAHAYCFWGPEGIGKDALALEFAKTLNCEQPLIRDGMAEACDTCKSCVQAAVIQHPNIQLVFSLPAAKSDDGKSGSPILKLSDDQIRLIQEQLKLKAEDPYHNITIPNATQIRIAAVRDVKKNISMSATQRGRRFVIISEADAMNQEAANAFLKTLEEPNANVTIILTTSRRDQLLATITSRCQQIRCDSLADTDVALALTERLAIPPEEAALIARLADGSYSKACELLNDDLTELRTEVVNLLRSMLKQRGYILQLSHRIETITGDKNRNRIEKMLILLLLWIRDAYALSVSQNNEVIINIDQLADLQNFVRNFSHAPLDRAAASIERSIELVRRNVDIGLLLTTLALELRSLMLLRR